MYVSFLYVHSQCLILYLWPLLPYISILFVQLLSDFRRPHTVWALIYTDPCVENHTGHAISQFVTIYLFYCQHSHTLSISEVQFYLPLMINVSLPHVTHVWCHRKTSLTIVYYPTVSFVFFRCLMVHILPSNSMPLLENVEKLSQTAIRHDSNTHMEIFGDHSDIFYPEFSFHMKHMGYFSPTMNS